MSNKSIRGIYTPNLVPFDAGAAGAGRVTPKSFAAAGLNVDQIVHRVLKTLGK